MKNLVVAKIGGNVVDNETALQNFVKSFAAIEASKILVHGGGKMATAVANALGIGQKMIDGRRITDAETLRVVTMVYAGQVNKHVVASLQGAACNAFGLCGADGNTILAHKRRPDSKIGTAGIDYGFAGDIDSINSLLLKNLIASDLCPVIAPITHDGNGQLLNTNADTIASAVAVAMSAYFNTQLVYCFEKSGVLLNLYDEHSVIKTISPSSYLALKQEGKLFAGMIPKIDNAFDSLHQGVKSVVIGHANDILQNTGEQIKGTFITL